MGWIGAVRNTISNCSRTSFGTIRISHNVENFIRSALRPPTSVSILSQAPASNSKRSSPSSADYTIFVQPGVCHLPGGQHLRGARIFPAWYLSSIIRTIYRIFGLPLLAHSHDFEFGIDIWQHLDGIFVRSLHRADLCFNIHYWDCAFCFSTLGIFFPDSASTSILCRVRDFRG